MEDFLSDKAYGLQSLSKKSWKPNHLQMKLQRQHFLFSYFKTLSVSLTGLWTRDTPHESTMLNKLIHRLSISNPF